MRLAVSPFTVFSDSGKLAAIQLDECPIVNALIDRVMAEKTALLTFLSSGPIPETFDRSGRIAHQPSLLLPPPSRYLRTLLFLDSPCPPHPRPIA